MSEWPIAGLVLIGICILGAWLAHVALRDTADKSDGSAEEESMR